jgi:hypothetical protein
MLSVYTVYIFTDDLDSEAMAELWLQQVWDFLKDLWCKGMVMALFCVFMFIT